MPTIKMRRGLAAVWPVNNVVLKSGELGVETDTHKLKIGDGQTAWNTLPYVVGGDSIPIIDNGDGTFTGGPVTGYTKVKTDALLAGYLRATDGAPLALDGQTPSQAPKAGGSTAVGILPVAARADHVHPAPAGLGFGTFLGTPAGRFTDIHLDGTDQTQDWYFRGAPATAVPLSSYITRSGSVYHIQNINAVRTPAIFYCGNFTLDAGVTLRGLLASVENGMPVVIVSNGTVTINGTISSKGESPAAGAAATQPAAPVDSLAWYTGLGGQTGGTGAGVAGLTSGGAIALWGLGGMGGKGGNSGGNTGGGASGYYYAALDGSAHTSDIGPAGLMFLTDSNYEYPELNNAPRGALGGVGGASGGGDGTNKGGSGGGGGGNIIIIAKKIVLGATAVLDASGGNGAPGAGGNAAGGGGGGMGIIALHATEIDIDPAAQLKTLPGNGGAGVGTGTAGDPGGTTAGYSPVVGDPPAPFGLGHGAGKIIMAWG